MNARGCTFEAIGTHWTITFPDTIEAHVQRNALAALRERIAQFDADYSRFRTDSWVSRIAQAPGTYTLPSDAKPMLDLYQELYTLTNGAVTPLIGDVLIAAGYDAHYSLTPQDVRPPYTWEEALRYEYPNLTLTTPTVLDFGAAGKGYLVDLVAEVLTKCGINVFTINAGGDICVRTKPENPVRVALEHPEDAMQAIGVATLHNASICGSAGNRRTWGEYTHIINPHTLHSPKDIAALWVVAQSTLVADALATALFFTKPEVLLPRYSFDYLLLHPDYSIERSPQFPAELFLS